MTAAPGVDPRDPSTDDRSGRGAPAIGAVVVLRDGAVVSVGPDGRRLLGALVDVPAPGWAAPSHRDRWVRALTDRQADRVELLTVDGHRFVVDGAGHEDLFVCSLTPTLDRVRLRAAMDAVFDGLVIVDELGRIVEINDVAARLLGRDADAMAGATLAEMLAGATSPSGAPLVLPDPSSLEELSGGVVEVAIAVDGVTRFLVLRPVWLGTPLGSAGAVLALGEASVHEASQRNLEYLAFHDSLTGLPNRRFLREQLDRMLANAVREGTTVSVLVFDLDGFKAVNDSYGHAAGDQLLRDLSARLQRALRSSDRIFRLGGDEFAVLVAQDDDADVVAQRIVELAAKPFELDGNPVVVGASIGIAASAGREDAERLLQEADLAMYEVKGRGKGSWARFHPQLHDRVARRAEVRADLQRALERDDELFLDFQPIVELATGTLLGAEALLRWNHRARGLLMPGAFVALAEQSGQIVEIGRWVLRRAVGELARWRRSGRVGGEFLLAVNVSPQQLLAPGYVADLLETLADNDVAAEHLVLEVTEGTAIAETAESRAVLASLRGHGIGLALDDYGSVHASITYLRQLPFTVLKVDRSLVSTLTVAGDGPGDSVVRSIVDVANLLGLSVLAEGIEEGWQRERLVALGCTAGQGYLFGRPGPATEVLRRLAR